MYREQESTLMAKLRNILYVVLESKYDVLLLRFLFFLTLQLFSCDQE